MKPFFVLYFRIIFCCLIGAVGCSMAAAQLQASKPTLVKPVQNSKFCDQIPSLVEPLLQVKNVEIDQILVFKSTKQMFLMSQGKVVKAYPVSFGFAFAQGPKIKEGDGKTPEGIYYIEDKPKKSNYHLALRISYPSAYDREFAQQNNVRVGSDIMIHGFPDKPIDGLDPVKVKKNHGQVHWTRGCIAVNNEQIEEIYSRVRVGTAIEICALNKPLHQPINESKIIQDLARPRASRF